MSDNLNIQRRTHLILDHTWNRQLRHTWKQSIDVPGNCNLSERAIFDGLAQLILEAEDMGEDFIDFPYGCELLVKIDGSVVIDGEDGSPFPIAAYSVKIGNVSAETISMRFQKRDEDDWEDLETVAYREMTYAGENSYGIKEWKITDR